MKKSVIVASAALAMCACLGVVGLVGCSGGNKDPYSGMQPISKNAFNTYISSAVTGIKNKEICISSTFDDADQPYYEVNLQSYTINNNLIAHGNLTINVTISQEEIKTYSGEVWLSNNILYVNNGEKTYQVQYNGKALYADSKGNDALTEDEIFQRYMYVALEETNKTNTSSTSYQTFMAMADHSVYYNADKNNNHYYMMEYGANNLGVYSKVEGAFKFQFDNENQLVSYSLSYSCDVKPENIGRANSVDLTLSIKSTDNLITLPSDCTEWQKV